MKKKKKKDYHWEMDYSKLGNLSNSHHPGGGSYEVIEGVPAKKP